MMLPYFLTLLKKLSDPNESSLTILARGLGLRSLICTLLKTFNVPNTLIFLGEPCFFAHQTGQSSCTFLVNASPDEENAIRESLSIMGCRPTLKIVGFETPRKERLVARCVFIKRRNLTKYAFSQILYKTGGLVSVTSRILIVDLLQSDVPVDKITGLIITHAERCMVSPHLWFLFTSCSG